MPCTPLKKVATTNVKRMCPNAAKTPLSEVLQSDAVKRLFNQPNLVIKTVPLNTQASKHPTVNNTYNNIGDDIAAYLNSQKDLKVSIVPVELDKAEERKSPNFLPSKRDGKSDISVVPIKREKRECGHYEPCENIVCDVVIRKYTDEGGETPLLAVNIETDEIDAPVSKHCSNKACDALSIDHNRCRRALIRLHRCDKSTICDICGATLKTRRARIQHKKCTRTNEYRHNDKHGPEILKDRMRERELEMLQASKTKRNDYMDPVTGYNHAIEALKKNDELIIITKTVPLQQSVIKITPVPNPDQSSLQKEVFGKIMLPQQSSVILARRINQDESNAFSTHQGTSQDTPRSNFVTAPTQHSASNNQYVRLPVVTQSNVQPVALNNLFVPHPHIVTTSATQSKPFLAPIRVVPITNLITPPSLLHQTQGIPRFCIMAGNEVSSTSMPATNPAQSTGSKASTGATKGDNQKMSLELQNSGPAKSLPKKNLKKKDFMCKYCLKCFSINWYFRMHVAMHKEETLLPCRLCEKTFNNRYDMKKHLMSEHRNENIPCDVCDEQMSSYPLYEKHMKTHSSTKSYKCSDCDTICTSSATIKYHRQHRHGLVECRKCCEEISETELTDHMAKEHKRTKYKKPKLQKTVKKNTIAYRRARQRELRQAKLLNGLETKPNGKDVHVKSEPKDERSNVDGEDYSITKNSLIPPCAGNGAGRSETMSEQNLL